MSFHLFPGCETISSASLWISPVLCEATDWSNRNVGAKLSKSRRKEIRREIKIGWCVNTPASQPLLSNTPDHSVSQAGSGFPASQALLPALGYKSDYLLLGTNSRLHNLSNLNTAISHFPGWIKFYSNCQKIWIISSIIGNNMQISAQNKQKRKFFVLWKLISFVIFKLCQL